MKKLLLLSCLLLSLRCFALITIAPTTYNQWVVLYKITYVNEIEYDTCLFIPLEIMAGCVFKSGHDEVMRVGCAVFTSEEMAICFCEYFNIRKYKKENL